MKTRLATYFLMICANCINTGCLPVPLLSSEESIKTEDGIKELVEKAANRSDVIRQYGNPVTRGQSTSYLACRSTTGAGVGFLLILPYQASFADLRSTETECFELALEFDGHHRLINYKKIPFTFNHQTPIKERIEFSRLMTQTPWKLYVKGSRDTDEIAWLCRAADMGYTYAQFELGRLFWRRNDLWDNKSKSYMWYMLASISNMNNGLYSDEAIQERAKTEAEYKRDEILTKEQLSKAMQLLLLWKPGQCGHELIPDAVK